MRRDNSFTIFKKHSIEAAKDLLYDKSVIERIKNAKTEEEITRIMKTARNNQDK